MDVEADAEILVVHFVEDGTPLAGVFRHFRGVLVQQEAHPFAADGLAKVFDGGTFIGEFGIGFALAFGLGVDVGDDGFNAEAGDLAGEGDGVVDGPAGGCGFVEDTALIDDGEGEFVLFEQAGRTVSEIGREQVGGEIDLMVAGIGEALEDFIEAVGEGFVDAFEVLGPDIDLDGEGWGVGGFGEQGRTKGEGEEVSAAHGTIVGAIGGPR